MMGPDRVSKGALGFAAIAEWSSSLHLRAAERRAFRLAESSVVISHHDLHPQSLQMHPPDDGRVLLCSHA